MSAAALMLGAVLALVPTAFTPEQAAHALCVSSLDPKCNPGNIPILIEAGVIAAPKPGAAVVAAAAPPATAGTGLVLDLSIVGAVTLAVAGFLGLTMDYGDGYKGGPALHQNGLGKIDIQTDPDYLPPGSLSNSWGGTTSGCTGWAGTDGVPSTGELGSYCPEDFPFQFARSSGALTEASLVAGGLLITSITGTSFSSFLQANFRTWCGTEPYNAGNVSLNAGWSAGSTRTIRWATTAGVPLLCPSGAAVNRITATGPFGPAGSGNALWTTTIWAAEGAATSDVMSGTTTASVDCKGPGGVQTVTASAPYSVTPGQAITTPEVVCPPGTIAVGGGLEVESGGTTTPVIPREENDVLPRISELVELLPHCFGPDAVPCPMVLEQLVDGVWQDCGPNGQYCPTWAQTPEPQLQAQYQCKVGGVVVDLRYCSAYRAPLIGVLPNVGEDGELLHPSAPSPNAGSLLQLTPPNGAPSGSLPPGWADLLGIDREPRVCWPTGWGVLNPIAWVYEPVRCAVEWAFMPRPSVVVQQAQQISTAWSQTPPAQIAVFLEELQQEVPTLDGCSGPRLVMDLELGDMVLEYDGYPISACQEPMSHLATVARTISALAMYWAAIVAISRYLGATMNFPQFGQSS
jgi:hypothetical protein